MLYFKMHATTSCGLCKASGHAMHRWCLMDITHILGSCISQQLRKPSHHHFVFSRWPHHPHNKQQKPSGGCWGVRVAALNDSFSPRAKSSEEPEKFLSRAQGLVYYPNLHQPFHRYPHLFLYPAFSFSSIHYMVITVSRVKHAAIWSIMDKIAGRKIASRSNISGNNGSSEIHRKPD